jgi:hypothetical protein
MNGLKSIATSLKYREALIRTRIHAFREQMRM